MWIGFGGITGGLCLKPDARAELRDCCKSSLAYKAMLEGPICLLHFPCTPYIGHTHKHTQACMHAHPSTPICIHSLHILQRLPTVELRALQSRTHRDTNTHTHAQTHTSTCTYTETDAHIQKQTHTHTEKNEATEGRQPKSLPLVARELIVLCKGQSALSLKYVSFISPLSYTTIMSQLLYCSCT